MSDMTKDSRITLRLPAELRRRVRDAAKRNGTREADFVRAAVEHQLASEETAATAYDRLKAAGLIGSVRGTKRDLSTNPKYMKGFGRS